MQQTQILLHILAVFYSLFSLRNPDHMRKYKFYYIENTNFSTFSSHFRWLEYVVKFVFAALAITYINHLSNTFCSKIYKPPYIYHDLY